MHSAEAANKPHLNVGNSVYLSLVVWPIGCYSVTDSKPRIVSRAARSFSNPFDKAKQSLISYLHGRTRTNCNVHRQ